MNNQTVTLLMPKKHVTTSIHKDGNNKNLD